MIKYRNVLYILKYESCIGVKSILDVGVYIIEECLVIGKEKLYFVNWKMNEIKYICIK